MVVPACLVYPGGMRQGLGVLHKHKGLVLFNQGKIKSRRSTKNDLERVCVCVQTVLFLANKEEIYFPKVCKTACYKCLRTAKRDQRVIGMPQR